MRILNLFLIMVLSLGILGVFGTINSPITTPATAGEHMEKSDSDKEKDTDTEKDSKETKEMKEKHDKKEEGK